MRYEISAKTLKRELMWLVTANEKILAVFHDQTRANDFAADLQKRRHDIDFKVWLSK